MSEGARRGLGKVVERRQGVRPVGQVATGDHDHTQLALHVAHPCEGAAAPLVPLEGEAGHADGGPAESLRHTAGLQTAVFRNVSAAEYAFP